MNEKKLAALGEVVKYLSGDFMIVQGGKVVFRGTAARFFHGGAPALPLDSHIIEIYVARNTLHIRIEERG